MLFTMGTRRVQASSRAGGTKFGPMAASTKESGQTIVQTERVSSGTLMVTSTRVTGMMTKLTVTGFTNMLMGPSTLENGKMINKMELDLRLGQMEAGTKVSIEKERSMERACTSGSTALSTLVNGPITK